MRTVEVTCAALLFDMDGTLVDSTAAVERQWARFAARHGLNYARIMEISHGRRNAETIREIAPHLATQEIFDRFDAEELTDREGIIAVRGAAALIESLRKDSWALVTSASRALAKVRLQCAGLPVPRVLVPAEDVRKGKPDPEGYLLAAARLGAESSECLVFEDTPAGLQAARAAGMREVGMTTTFSCARLGAAMCIGDFEAVQSIEQFSVKLRLRLNVSL